MKYDDKDKFILNERFKHIYGILKDRYKVKEIIERLSFSGSRQLYNILEDKNLVTSHAIYNLVQNFNVNPQYLFFGEGHEFIDNAVQDAKDLKWYKDGKETAEMVILKQGIYTRELEKQLKTKEENFNEVLNVYKIKINQLKARLSRITGDDFNKKELEDTDESIKEISVEEEIRKYVDSEQK